MCVSIEVYRQRIGCFSNKKSKQKCKYYKTGNQNRRNRYLLSLLSKILLISIIAVLASPSTNFQPLSIHPLGRLSNPEQHFDVSFQPSASSPITLHPSGRIIYKLCSNLNLAFQPSGICWSYSNKGSKLAHAVNGNKRNTGYKYLAWNCARGFLKERKIDDLKVTINRHKPHLVSVSEIDLYRRENNSDINATNNFSSNQLHERLYIPGYKIFLPKSWETLGVARVVVYAKDDLKVKLLHPPDHHYNHIQNVTLEVGFGRSKTHICNFYYREWTSCRNGRDDKQNQEEDLELLLDIWRNCCNGEKDFVALGDMNLCSKRWEESSYPHKELANKVKDFMCEENCSQVVDGYTRIRDARGLLQRSCIDHATVNCVSKISSPLIIGVGQSDHLGILITKASKEVRTYARTTRKRVYKNFSKESFIKDIQEAKAAGKFESVHTNSVLFAGTVLVKKKSY